MNDNRLQILVSTMNKENDKQIKDLLLEMKIKSDYLIINQTDKNVNINNSKVLTVNDKGLSKSRNLGLENATSDIILFADDDLSYTENYETIIKEAYKKYQDTDCICFWVESKNKFRPIKRMKNGKIGIFKIMKICSFQITVKRKAIENIKFDENYGAGTYLDRGEETIFLKQLLEKGYKIRFENQKIAEVKQENSTWFDKMDKEYFLKQGKIFKKIYPKIYPIIDIQFLIRKHKLYKKNIKLIEALKTMLF